MEENIEAASCSKQLGQLGEKLAQQYLVRKDYRIIATNWKFGRIEIDIVAEREGKVVFVEVKTRRSQVYNDFYPCEAVNYKKQAHIKRAAEVFLRQHFGRKAEISCRFDIVAIESRSANGAQHYKISHIEEAFR